MSDWLFDGGPPEEPEDVAIVAGLHGLRRERVVPPLPERPAARPRTAGRWRRPLVIATAVLLAAGLLLTLAPRDRWEVTALSGERPCWIGPCGLGVGGALTTNAESAWEVRLGALGTVTMGPGTELSRLPAERGALLHLADGSLDVALDAPPRAVRVETPAALVVDLGCAYTLTATATETRLSVHDGSVSLENDQGISIVTAGSSATVHLGARPELPVQDDASPAFRSAVARFDGGKVSDDSLVDDLLAAARPKDNPTLWHVLQLLPPEPRTRLYDGMHVACDRDGVLDLDGPALQQWWQMILAERSQPPPALPK
jgi:hypothetical protein